MARQGELAYWAGVYERRFSYLVLLAVGLFLVLPRPAQAWIETAIRSHEAHVSVDAEGQAVVRHALVLKVRGGPLKFVEIPGVGDGIEPLADASVRRAMRGSGSVWPLEQAVTEDGALRLRIGAERGIRGGSYRFEFAYRMDLAARDWLVPKGDGTQVTWVGPRLSTGVDSAKVVFEFDRGAHPPELAAPEQGASATVLLGQVRRGADKDEIELVRAHVARGEPAVWQVRVAPGVIATGSGPLLEAAPTLPVVQRALRGRGHQPLEILALALVALTFGVIVLLKSLAMRRAAAAMDAHLRPLFPGGPWLRAAIGAASAALGTWCVVTHRPLLAVVAVGVCMLTGTHLLPVRQLRPRGPANWEQLESEDDDELRGSLPGAVFELSRLRGFVLFALLCVVTLGVAYRLLPSSNYLALMSLLFVVALLPVFWTGRHADLPPTPAQQAGGWFAFVRRAFADSEASVQLWGRRPTAVEAVAGDSSATIRPPCDEARIRLVPQNPPSGLRALEISFDEGAGAHVLPCVVVRVLEDSPAKKLLPADIPWQRGRSSDERVAILRPTTPARAQLLRLLRSLMTSLRYRGGGASQKPARSSGKVDSATNLVPSAAAPAM